MENFERIQKNSSLSDSERLFRRDTQFGSGTESEMAASKCSPPPEEFTYINDPIHGMMEIHPLCMAIVNTPEFQRLRFVKQCGVCNFIYPGAVHTRFDHSLGVCYLAFQIMKKLKDLEDDISEEESLCVQIAGLCHDLGQGPFSHFWKYYLYKLGENFKPGEMSTLIFDKLYENNELESKFNKYGLSSDLHLPIIKALITGEQKDPKVQTLMKYKSYLFEIIVNKKSGLDLDKYDYLMRDSYFFGIKVSADFHRYLMCISVWKDDKGIKHLALRDKSKRDVENIFHERLKMYYYAYQHRICIAINAMLVDAFKAAEDYYHVKIGDTEYKLSQCHKHVEAMLKLTDKIVEDLYFSADVNLATANKIIERIYKRKLYKECGIFPVDQESYAEQEKLFGKTELTELYVIELSKIEERISKKHFGLVFRCGLKTLDVGQTGGKDHLKNIIFLTKFGETSDRIKEGIDFTPKNVCPIVLGFVDRETIKAPKDETVDSVQEEILAMFEVELKNSEVIHIKQ